MFQTLIDELEQRLEGCHKKGLNEDEIAEKAGKSPVQPKRGKTPRKPTKTPGYVEYSRSIVLSPNQI